MWLQIAWVSCRARNGNVLAKVWVAVETHFSIANTSVATCRIRFDALVWRVFLVKPGVANCTTPMPCGGWEGTDESVPIGRKRGTVGIGWVGGLGTYSCY